MHPPYEKPEIVTRSADEVLEILGPVQGYGSGGGSGTELTPMVPAGGGGSPRTPGRR